MRVDYNKRTVKQCLTTGKSKIKNFLKLPSATSFIRSRYTQLAMWGYYYDLWHTNQSNLSNTLRKNQ